MTVAVLALALAVLLGWTLHARFLRRSLHCAWADLDEAALTVARLAAERDRAERRAARAALRSIKRRTALRRIARYCRDLRDDLDIADVVGAELAAGLHEQAARYDAAIQALTTRIADLTARETSASIAAWQNATFGPATTCAQRVMDTRVRMIYAFEHALRVDLTAVPRPNLSRAIRAAEELAELIELLVANDADPKAPEECWDIGIVLRGIDAYHGVEHGPGTDRKMAKNRARRWRVTGDGHGQHIEPCTDRTAFVDGELSPEQAAGFRDHLATCPSCSEQLAGDVALATQLSPDRIPPTAANCKLLGAERCEHAPMSAEETQAVFGRSDGAS